jgi:nucleotide-binding universal stress UspA family protein
MVHRIHRRSWTVVVAVDGSRGSKAALRFAAGLARQKPTAMSLLTVATSTSARSAELTRARGVLRDASDLLAREGVPSESRVVWIRPEDSIPEAICRASDRLRADLVVVGSEGRDTLREWVVGGVALRLLYLSSRPVVVVRPPRRHAAAAKSAAR